MRWLPLENRMFVCLFSVILGTLDWTLNRQQPANHFDSTALYVLDGRIFDRCVATKLPSIGRKFRVLSVVYPFGLYRNGTAYPRDYSVYVRRRCTPTWCPNYYDKYWTVDLSVWASSRRMESSEKLISNKLLLILFD